MTLEQLWDRLRRVRSLSFVASSPSQMGWTGRGSGTVEVGEVAPGVLTFTEWGTWRQEGGKDIRFHNVYRWTLVGELLRLEHLRMGEANPVHLFDLAPTGEGEWRPAAPHLCREDCYDAVLLARAADVVLRWSVTGPRKQANLEYLYTAVPEKVL